MTEYSCRRSSEIPREYEGRSCPDAMMNSRAKWKN